MAHIEEAEQNVKLAELRLRDQKNHMRPSSHYDVMVRWSHTFGAYVAFRENIAAKGDTPEIAMDNFDHLWHTGEGRVNLPDDFDEDFNDFD
jgi:hypothetical protein